jgi:hypothetical protein
MKACAMLLSLYDRWRKLTESEAAAIRNLDWDGVGESQRAKAILQGEIEHWTEVAKCELEGRPADQKALGAELRRLIPSLAEMERGNAAFLARSRLELGQEELATQSSARNLQKLRHSYGCPPSANWQSYS